MRGAVLAAVLLLTACGSAPALQAQTSAQPTATAASAPPQTPSSSPAVTPAPSPSAAPTPSSTGVKACATSALKLSLVGTQGAAGHIFANLALTNSSSSSCTLDGFPNGQLFNA